MSERDMTDETGGRDWLAERFEANRGHLRAIAYRMLGSTAEADDAVQEAWLKVGRAGAAGVENLGGWLTTIVARVCLDMLRSRAARREEAFDPAGPEPAAPVAGSDPEDQAVMADAVGPALLLLLDTLTPAERLAFVLHDLFGVPFDEVAPIVDRSPAAARQLASRARRRVRGAGTTGDADADPDHRREVVAAFLAASREGRFADLLALLDPDVVLRADQVAVATSAARLAQGAPPLEAERRGARAVAEVFSGRAQAAQLVLINGNPGAAWAPGGKPRGVFAMTVVGGTITTIDIVGDPARIAELDVVLL